MTEIKKSFEAIRKANEAGKDGLTFLASVELPDRDNDIIYISGIDTANIQKNPVFLANHNIRSKPIGKITAFRKMLDGDPKSLEIDVVFADTEDGIEYKYLYENGFMNAVSIQFVPKVYNRNEERKGYDVYESELLEVSAVTVPANQYALVKKGFQLERQTAELLAKVESLTDEINSEKAKAESMRYIIAERLQKMADGIESREGFSPMLKPEIVERFKSIEKKIKGE
jgi:HK97 family phage prohead protease